MEYIFLNQTFYDNHPESEYKQLERKVDRPYIHIISEYNGIKFAIPLRSDIKHPHVFFTDKQNNCGVDYSKAVPIQEGDIDYSRKPHIRSNEHKRLLGKEKKIQKGFSKYIQTYKDAKNDMYYDHRDDILNFSSLQYFESYIYSYPTLETAGRVW